MQHGRCIISQILIEDGDNRSRAAGSKGEFAVGQIITCLKSYFRVRLFRAEAEIMNSEGVLFVICRKLNILEMEVCLSEAGNLSLNLGLPVIAVRRRDADAGRRHIFPFLLVNLLLELLQMRTNLCKVLAERFLCLIS